MSGLAPSKVGPIGLIWDKSGIFSNQISVNFWLDGPNIPKSDLKSPGYVPFWDNLTNFGARPDIPDFNNFYPM